MERRESERNNAGEAVAERAKRSVAMKPLKAGLVTGKKRGAFRKH